MLDSILPKLGLRERDMWAAAPLEINAERLTLDCLEWLAVPLVGLLTFAGFSKDDLLETLMKSSALPTALDFPVLALVRSGLDEFSFSSGTGVGGLLKGLLRLRARPLPGRAGCWLDR